MIPIVKGPPPQVLLARGAAAAVRLINRYNQNAGLPSAKRKKLTISSSIYGHATVRNALNRSHHGKCAYCEVRIPKPYADAHVEHWRPKGSVKQLRNDRSAPPGYYWLAYDWDNLLLACLFCNRGNKGTIFPLDIPANRAWDHNHPIGNEVPLLLKPDDGTDPRDHIEFVDELPRPRNGSVRGAVTIDVLGLDRLEHKPRDELLMDLQAAYDQVVEHNGDPHPAAQKLVRQGRDLYATAPLASSPFSAMAAAFITANPLPAPVALPQP